MAASKTKAALNELPIRNTHRNNGRDATFVQALATSKIMEDIDIENIDFADC